MLILQGQQSALLVTQEKQILVQAAPPFKHVLLALMDIIQEQEQVFVYNVVQAVFLQQDPLLAIFVQQGLMLCFQGQPLAQVVLRGLIILLLEEP